MIKTNVIGDLLERIIFDMNKRSLNKKIMDTQLQVGGCLVNMPCAKILLLGKLITANACLQACTIKEAGENKPIPSEIQVQYIKEGYG